MKELKIEINGQTEGDLVLAIEEVKAKVGQGYLAGADRNETGNYNFDITEV